MSTKDEIFDYVNDSPENINPAVLRSLLNSLEGADLPIATEDILGGIKVGSGLSITEEGVLSSSGGGGGGLPDVTSADEGRCLQVSATGEWIKTWPTSGPEGVVPNFTVVESEGVYSIVSGSTFVQCRTAAKTIPSCMAVIYGPCFDGGACLPVTCTGDGNVFFSGIMPKDNDLFAVTIKLTEDNTKTVVVKKLT